MHCVGQGWHPDPDIGMNESAENAHLAISLDPNNALALAIAGHIEAFLYRRLDSAECFLSRSLLVNPNSGMAWAFHAVLACYIGAPAEALSRMKRYQRLCPFDPAACYFKTIYVIAYTILHDFEKAVLIGKELIMENPNFVNGYKPLITSLWHLKQYSEAGGFAEQLLSREPDFSIEKFCRTYPFRREDDMSLYVSAFRGVGIPETTIMVVKSGT